MTAMVSPSHGPPSLSPPSLEFNPIVNLKLNNREDEQKQRTSVLRNTRNPVWNPPEIFHFTLPEAPVKLILYMYSHPKTPLIYFISVSRVKNEKHSLGLHALDITMLTETPTYMVLPLTLGDGSISNSEVTSLPYPSPSNI